MRKVFSEVAGGPPAIGPYSPAVIGEGKFLFVSGQIPFDVAEGKIVRGSVSEQTRIVLENLKRLVEAGGSSLDQIVSCRVYLQPLSPETFAEMNAVYAEVFGESKPARATVGAGLLGFDVEIEAIAVI